MFASSVAMSSQNQIPNGSAILLRFSDILRPQLIAHVQAKFDLFLKELPAKLMQVCENLPDSQQQKYMDIIVILRHHAAEISDEVARAYNQQWQKFQALNQNNPTSTLSDLSLSSMSLLGSDELEQSVVIDTQSTRLAGQINEVLVDAFNRLQVLAPSLKQADQLPFHPKSLLQIVPDSFAIARISADQSIILIKEFAGYLEIKALAPLIEQSLTQGQVPEAVSVVRSSSDAEPEEKEKEPELVDVLRDIRDLNKKNAGSGAGNAGGELRSEINPDPSSPLLQTTSGGGVVVDPARLVEQAAYFAQISQSVASVPLMPQNIFPLAQEQMLATVDLMERLGKLQQSQPLTSVNADSEVASVSEVREHIRNQLQNDEDTVEVIGKKDTDLINLVSAMFDYILDDQDLPTAMKALLGRLQIPMLKVALIDELFFKTEKHPARLLLNSLAKAGVSWDEKAQSSDVLYKKIEETVFTILTDFHNDMQLFEQLLKEFNQFYEEQQARVAIIDQRTREAEERRAKADMARSVVQLALNQKLTGRKLPLAVIRLLQDGWRHVLYLSFLKDGKDAESWRQAVKVVDALIWSMTPVREDDAWLERLKSVAPKLVNSLRKGLASVNFDQVKTDSLIREIEDVHQKTIQGLTLPVVEIVTEDKETRADGVKRQGVEDALKSPNADLQSVILPKSEIVDLYQGETLPSADKFVQVVKQLKIGVWIEFTSHDKTERHKLVARIRSMEKLIFANRRGIKVAEMSQMHLAVELSQGRARLVDDQPQIIDRALQSVVGGLRQLTA